MQTTERFTLDKNQMTTGNVSSLTNKIDRISSAIANSDTVFKIGEVDEAVIATTPLTLAANRYITTPGGIILEDNQQPLDEIEHTDISSNNILFHSLSEGGKNYNVGVKNNKFEVAGIMIENNTVDFNLKGLKLDGKEVKYIADSNDNSVISSAHQDITIPTWGLTDERYLKVRDEGNYLKVADAGETYYNKTEVDQKFTDADTTILNRHYTKGEVDDLLANSGTDLTNYYNKTDCDNKFETIENTNAHKQYAEDTYLKKSEILNIKCCPNIDISGGFYSYDFGATRTRIFSDTVVSIKELCDMEIYFMYSENISSFIRATLDDIVSAVHFVPYQAESEDEKKRQLEEFVNNIELVAGGRKEVLNYIANPSVPNPYVLLFNKIAIGILGNYNDLVRYDPRANIGNMITIYSQEFIIKFYSKASTNVKYSVNLIPFQTNYTNGSFGESWYYTSDNRC